MPDVLDLVKDFIYKHSIGEDFDLEDYVRESFKKYKKAELKKYCKDNTIFLKSRDINREDFLMNIYGSCNVQLGFRALSTTNIEGESLQEFFTRVYDREYK